MQVVEAAQDVHIRSDSEHSASIVPQAECGTPRPDALEDITGTESPATQLSRQHSTDSSIYLGTRLSLQEFYVTPSSSSHLLCNNRRAAVEQEPQQTKQARNEKSSTFARMAQQNHHKSLSQQS